MKLIKYITFKRLTYLIDVPVFYSQDFSYNILTMQNQKLTLLRLQKQEASLQLHPIPQAVIARQDLLKFYFCLHNLDGDFKQGFYFGLLQLHENYPFNAPKLFFYTPTGRFECNISICMSFTTFHQETWSSAWNIRSMILAIISFMYSNEPSFGSRNDPNDIRRKLASESLEFNLKNQTFVKLFYQKMIKLNKIPPNLILNEKKIELKTIKTERIYIVSQQLMRLFLVIVLTIFLLKILI